MTDEDIKLFRQAVEGARPLRGKNRVQVPDRKPRPVARFARADRREVLRESLGADIDTMEYGNADSLHFHRSSVSRRTLRRLARGAFSVQDEIDLHGMTVSEAKTHLAEFIERCARNGRLCVRIIHGKGRGSGHRGPVLKASVNSWLRRWDVVLAFISARQVDGGTGAVYVLLKPL